MRVATISPSAVLVVSAVAAALGAGSCGSERPLAPTAASMPAAQGADSTARAKSEGNSPPTAVFKTTPLAGPGNVIAGGSSFDVTYNLCQSSDPDPDDELKFTFDFD